MPNDRSIPVHDLGGVFRKDFWTERRARLALAAFLFLIAFLGATETMIAPGRLLRRPLGFQAIDPFEGSQIDSDAKGLASHPAHPTVSLLDEALGTDRLREESRERQIEQRRQSIDSLLTQQRQRLESARTSARTRFATFSGAVLKATRVNLETRPFDPSLVPSRLNRLVLADQTVATAWQATRQVTERYFHADQQAIELAAITFGVTSKTEQLESHRKVVDAAVLELQETERAMAEAAIADVAHLNVMLRADESIHPNN